MNLQDLFTEIAKARSESLSRDLGPYPKNNPTASDLSPCPRETSLAILHWQERPPFNVDIAARLEVGRDSEPQIVAKLIRCGILVVEQQSMYSLTNKAGRTILRGKIDGKVELPDRRRIPFDIKTMNPNAFNQTDTVDDLYAHPFFCKWPKQVLAYEYMNNIETGFLLLDNLLGQWKFIEVPMDWNRMDSIIKQCEAAVDAVEAVMSGRQEEDVLPPYHPDPAVCMKCWAYKRLCTPPADFHGLSLMTDPEVEGLLDRRGELEASKKEYDKLDKIIKEKVKEKDGLLVGQWLIQGKFVKRDGYEVKAIEYWLPKITKAEV